MCRPRLSADSPTPHRPPVRTHEISVGADDFGSTPDSRSGEDRSSPSLGRHRVSSEIERLLGKGLLCHPPETTACAPPLRFFPLSAAGRSLEQPCARHPLLRIPSKIGAS